MPLMPRGGQLVGPPIQNWFDKIYIDRKSGRLRFPIPNDSDTGPSTTMISTAPEIYNEIFHANMALCLADLNKECADKEVNVSAERDSWYRQVPKESKPAVFESYFEHDSGRYLDLELTSQDAHRLSYQRIKLGIQRLNMEAFVQNYVQPSDWGSPKFEVMIGFHFAEVAIARLASEALKSSPFTEMYRIALKMAEHFYLSVGYFPHGSRSRLRIRLMYEGRDRAQSAFLNPSREGLVPEAPIKTDGLKKFHVCSCGDETSYFNIYGDIGKHSLNVYSDIPEALGQHSLQQRPMPALLWDFVREQTGVSLEESISQSA